MWVGAGGDMVGGAQQNRVTLSPFDFGLWTWTWIVTNDFYLSGHAVDTFL